MDDVEQQTLVRVIGGEPTRRQILREFKHPDGLLTSLGLDLGLVAERLLEFAHARDALPLLGAKRVFVDL